MCGSKSKSSTSSEQSQTTVSADGFVTGQVFNVVGKDNVSLSYTDEFSERVADIFSQLIEFAGVAGKTALDATQSAYSQASQPDIDLVKEQSKYTPLVVLGVVGLTTLILIFGKK